MTQAIVDGDQEIAADLTRQALEQSVHPMDAINHGLLPGMDRVGESFSCGEAFLPELVMAGEAMKAAIDVLDPVLNRLGSARQVAGKVVLGTVQGDIHDIGKTLVGSMLTANGFEVHDLGVDVAAEAFIEKAVAVGADIIGLSALLTTTMINQRDLITRLEKQGLRQRFKVMVGGAPVTRSWADEIGADGFSEDAIGAVAIARQLCGVA